MADAITIQLTSNAAAVTAALQRFTPAMQSAIGKALDLENQLSIESMSLNKMHGPRPQVLGAVTQDLVRSINATPAAVGDTTVDSAIGTNLVYAGVHEFGFDGNVNVSAFSRRNARRNVYAPRKDGRGNTKRIVAEGASVVRAHSRHMRMPQRSFIRSTISERTDDYSAAVSGAIEQAIGGVSS